MNLIDEDHIQFRYNSLELDSIQDGLEEQRSLESSISALDPIHRQVPVSKVIDTVLLIHTVDYVLNRTLSLKQVSLLSIWHLTLLAPGWTMTNPRRRCNEAQSFSFHPNSFVRSSLSSPTEDHYNFAMQ